MTSASIDIDSTLMTRVRATNQYVVDESVLAHLEQSLCDGVEVYTDEKSEEIRPPLPTEMKEKLVSQWEFLWARLASPQYYLPARGMKSSQILAFATDSHEPELPGPLLDELARTALAKRDGCAYVGCFGSGNRMFPFLTIHAALSDREYWRTLADVWIYSEWSLEYSELWPWLFLHNRKRSGAVGMMNAEERACWDELAPEFMVYRGQQEEGDAAGFSWTLSLQKAVWFATTYKPRDTSAWRRGKGVVLSGTVSKSDAIAYLNRRGEEEVLIPNGKVRGIRYEKASVLG